MSEIDVNNLVDNPFNPRGYYDEESIRQLAESINQHGLIHKILVRKRNGKFEIATGHRRFKAIKLLGWEKVSVEVRELTDAQMLEVAVIENIQRQDLTNVEVSLIIGHYLSQGLTQEQISKKLSKSQPWVSQAVTLKDLPDEIKNDVIRRLIPQSYATEYANFQYWFESQLHPKLKGEERQQHILSYVKATYKVASEDQDINSVRKLADMLETIKWNLLRSRVWWFSSDYERQNWESSERNHHQSNIRDLKLKHEMVNEKELIWIIKKTFEWFPEEEHEELGKVSV